MQTEPRPYDLVLGGKEGRTQEGQLPLHLTLPPYRFSDFRVKLRISCHDPDLEEWVHVLESFMLTKGFLLDKQSRSYPYVGADYSEQGTKSRIERAIVLTFLKDGGNNAKA